MLREKLASIKKEILSFSAMEKLFIFSVMVCSFCITSDYAIIRPVSNSVFIHSYGAGWFPYAWLATVPFNFLIVALYNRFLPKLGCLKMFYVIITCVMGSNLFFALFIKQSASLPFIFYIWKEVYILLMFQQLWSLIHSTITHNRAKYLYGILFAVGGAGGAIGSLLPGYFAVKMGSETLLYFTIPIFLVLTLFFSLAVKNSLNIRGSSDLKDLSKGQERGVLLHSLKLITSSRLLTFILLLVVFMQLSATIIDYQFNTILETTYPDKDIRTEYCGRILSVVNTATVTLQVFGCFLLLHFLGLKGSHFFVPLVLCVNAIGFLLFPFFGVISFSYITIKAFDFSVFGVIKEMLYIPLKMDEKFRAKAVIDVFAYRTAKAFGSFLILFFQFLPKTMTLNLLTFGLISIFLIWSCAVLYLFKHYKQVAEPSAS